MKAINKFLIGAAILIGAATIVSCADNSKLIGKWETSTPATVYPTIPGTVSSTSLTTIEFSKGTDSKSGPVKLTTIYEMTLPTDSVGGMNPVSTVNATVNGTWTRDENDDDDYFLSFDRNSLSVNAISAPELGPVTNIFLTSLARYTRIDDVEVNKANTVLTFEDTSDSSYVLSRVNE